MFMPIAGSQTSPSRCDVIKDMSFYRTQKFKVIKKISCFILAFSGLDQILKNSPEKNDEFFVVPKVIE